MEVDKEGSRVMDGTFQEDGEEFFPDSCEQMVPGDEAVDGLTVRRSEAEVLIRHHLGAIRRRSYDTALFGMYFGGSDAVHWARLDAIREVVGEEEFERMVAPEEQKWQEAFNELSRALSEPGTCEICWMPFQRTSFNPDDPICGRRSCQKVWGEREEALGSLARYTDANLLRSVSCLPSELYRMCKDFRMEPKAQEESSDPEEVGPLFDSDQAIIDWIRAQSWDPRRPGAAEVRGRILKRIKDKVEHSNSS
jgi:hypothetical protein